jgi:3-oxoacyl-[acyl-carrier-protein] synthase II
MSDRQVLITGAGVISPLGVHLAELAEALAAGRSGVGEIAGFDARDYPCRYGAEVLDLELGDFLASSKTYLDRTSAFALAACADALKEAGWGGDETVGLVLGTAWGCLDSLELFAEKFATGKRKLVPPLPFSHSYANAPNSLAAIEFKLRGFNACLTSGHVAGAAAIEYAARRIRLGKDRRLLAGGSDALSESIFHAYGLRGVLSRDGQARPYDPASGGLVLGEGAAVFALEDAASAAARGARPLARLLGCGAANGAGVAEGLTRSTRLALEDAAVPPDGVGLVVGIGCGLPALDAAEREALGAVFGEGVPPLATVKALAGEAMGAGGPLSLAAALVCLADGVPSSLLAPGRPAPDVPGCVLVNAADPSGASVSLLVAVC